MPIFHMNAQTKLVVTNGKYPPHTTTNYSPKNFLVNPSYVHSHYQSHYPVADYGVTGVSSSSIVTTNAVNCVTAHCPVGPCAQGYFKQSNDR